jgi:hypothetical protein
VAGKKAMQEKFEAAKLARNAATKTSSKPNGKKVEVLPLPSVKIFGTSIVIVPSAEKGQIADIFVEIGDKKIQIFKNSSWLPGVHPNIAEFLFYAVIGGAGTARGARQLGFAHWVNEQAPKFNKFGFTKSLAEYNVVVNYAKRGGMMVYPLKDLVAMCALKDACAKESYKRYPREIEDKQIRTKKSEDVEVTVFL